MDRTLVLVLVLACGGNKLRPDGSTDLDGVENFDNETPEQRLARLLNGATVAFTTQPQDGLVHATMAAVRVQLFAKDGTPLALEGVAVSVRAMPGVVAGVTMARTDATGAAELAQLQAPDDAGAHVLMVTAATLAEVPSAPFVLSPLAADPTQSRVTLASLVVAGNGVDVAHIDVDLRDQFGNALPARQVTVQFSDRADVTFTTGVGYDVTKNSPGIVTVSTTVAGQTLSAQITFTGMPDYNHYTFTATPAEVPADGVSVALLSVSVRDINDVPLVGYRADFSAINGDNININACETASDGTCSVTFATSVPQRVSFQSFARSASVLFTPQFRRGAKTPGVFVNLAPYTESLIFASNGYEVFRVGGGANVVDVGEQLPPLGAVGMSYLQRALILGATQDDLYFARVDGVWRSHNASAVDPRDVNWERIHPSSINDIAVRGQQVYLAVADGVLASSDGGASFTVIPGSTGVANVRLAIDPRSPTTFYSGGNGSGVRKYDGAWTTMTGGCANVESLAVDSTGIVYCVDNDIYRAPSGAFSLVPTTYGAFDVHLDSADHVYTNAPDGTEYSADGTSFAQLSSGHPLTQENSYAQFWSIEGVPGAMMLASSAYGIYKSTGADWTPQIVGDPYMVGEQPELAYGSRLYAVNAPGIDVWRSDDRGDTWTRPAVLPNQYAGSLTTVYSDPSSPDTLYIGTSLKGPYRWQSDSIAAFNTGMATSEVRGFARSADGLFAATSNGVFASTGGSWVNCDLNLLTPNVTGVAGSSASIVISFASGGVARLVGGLGGSWVMASGATGETKVYQAGGTLFATGNGIRRSTDGGGSFVATSLATGTFHHLIGTPDGLKAWVIRDDGHLYESADGGATWTVMSAPNVHYPRSLAHDGTTLWVGEADGAVLRGDNDGHFPP